MHEEKQSESLHVICQTRNLTKNYKDGAALKEVNLTVHKGDIFGLIGENGAGKTTLIKLLAGPPDKRYNSITWGKHSGRKKPDTGRHRIYD